ncbi:hypothetical protein HNQ59_003202 [Chitinivorax tropicus]|uniref:Uncharacterized protein n=1 Tax=Chitinivorax tropicus TaxID=714531 RepID=A0A840ML56_9PROT|nr:hypothetical protein [Chitinivorax tropicus]
MPKGEVMTYRIQSDQQSVLPLNDGRYARLDGVIHGLIGGFLLMVVHDLSPAWLEVMQHPKADGLLMGLICVSALVLTVGAVYCGVRVGYLAWRWLREVSQRRQRIVQSDQVGQAIVWSYTKLLHRLLPVYWQRVAGSKRPHLRCVVVGGGSHVAACSG